MISASISAVKNRLSHYLNLIKGGEAVEITDRGIPVARIVHIGEADPDRHESSWIFEMQPLSIVNPPWQQLQDSDLINQEVTNQDMTYQDAANPDSATPMTDKPGSGVLAALLEEREENR